MHSTRKLLWIITFMTLLQDLLANNVTESSQSTVNIRKSNNTLSVTSYDEYYTHPLRITAIFLLILIVFLQVCYLGIYETENTRDRVFVWCFWHFPRYVINRIHRRNLQRRLIQVRAHLNGNVHMQQEGVAENEV